MSTDSNQAAAETRLELPARLRGKLLAFQRRLWAVKLAEGALAGLLGLLVSYLLVFSLDRLFDASSWLRMAVLAGGLAALVLYLPWMVRRWVWTSRRLRDVARMLSATQRHVGDNLLGIIELAEEQEHGQASLQLCRAAIAQVDEDTREMDFRECVPHPRHVRWGWAAGIAGALTLAALLVPGAGWNALHRWATPWKDVPRYTFAQLDPLPAELVVPLGEPFTLRTRLAENTAWKPLQGWARLGWGNHLTAKQEAGGYLFEMPAFKQPRTIRLRVGDALHSLQLQPLPRPELTGMVAAVELPKYLGHQPHQRDVRGGSLTLVKGSTAVFEATASRELADASINGDASPARLQGSKIVTHPVSVSQPETHQFTWKDVVGLSAKQPFKLRIRPVDDEAPQLICRDFPRESVLLDDEVLAFAASVEDDFGVRKVGMVWQGIPGPYHDEGDPLQSGEAVLAAGNQQQRELETTGAFSAKALGIRPQTLEVRLYAEDYHPERQRVYSPVYRIYVLTPEQHMIWLTEKLQEWQRQVLEVRDQEQRLLEKNLEFRQMAPEQLDEPGMRRKLEQQAAAESRNGRRLDGLVVDGDKLVKQAIRNSEFNSNSLESLAQTLQGLKKLSSERMPSVADLLKKAAAAPTSASAKTKDPLPNATTSDRGANRDPESKPPGDSQPKAPKQGKIGLPTNVMQSPSPPRKPGESPSGDQVDRAVEEQQALLDEFNRLMDEMSKILNDLEGSTFVKRLKFAARRELKLAKNLGGELSSFGQERDTLKPPTTEHFGQLAEGQTTTSLDVALIQEDLQAYFQRTEEEKFQQVFAEMQQTRVSANLRQMAQALQQNYTGETIAEAQYWVDQLDRWAEMLVGPGCKCSGSKACESDNIPPHLVLEVLRILQAEIELRELTRVAEQKKPALLADEFRHEADQLAQTQTDLEGRTRAVIDELEEFQRTENRNFQKAIAQLGKARQAMQDATHLLQVPDTGPPTIAAETEAIEWLLVTKRSGGGGGGGGATPGGGTGGGTTDAQASALAGIGEGVAAKARQVDQASGTTDDGYPEEYRARLDAYFNALEK